MRRAIGEEPTVGRDETRFRLAALAIVLAVMAPPGARGDGPSPNQPDGRISADNGAAAGPPADPAVRRADARPHGGLGSALAAPFRHLRTDACIWHAFAAAEKDDFNRVIAECTEAIRIDPREAQAYFVRSTAWLQMNQLDRALSDLTEAIRLEPRAAIAYTGRAGVWAMKGDLDKAIADYSQVIQIDPTMLRAYTNRAGLWGMKHEWDKAIADCNQAIRLDPRYTEGYVMRGCGWAKKGELNRALSDLTEAIRLEPRLANAYSSRGCIWLEKNQPDKALADFDEEIRLEPREPAAYSNRAGVWAMKSQWDRMIADLDEAIRLNPRQASMYVTRGTAWSKRGAWDRALADFNEVIRIDPRNGLAFSLIAWVRATCPDPEYRDGKKALEAANRACELGAWKDPYPLGMLAASCAEAGDFDAAVRWQTKANALYPDAKAKTDGEALLKLYQSRTPYREPRP
jgi:tetratricopeptide (TPR) repeat protein